MHIHLGFLTPLLWCAVAFVAIQLRHRRKMERLRLGVTDPRERLRDIGERLRDTGERMRDRYATTGERMRDRYDMPQAEPDLPSADRRELEALRERVKVLERIATEDRKPLELAREIEALRDR
jgi:hypothetical protein